MRIESSRKTEMIKFDTAKYSLLLEDKNRSILQFKTLCQLFLQFQVWSSFIVMRYFHLTWRKLCSFKVCQFWLKILISKSDPHFERVLELDNFVNQMQRSIFVRELENTCYCYCYSYAMAIIPPPSSPPPWPSTIIGANQTKKKANMHHYIDFQNIISRVNNLCTSLGCII